MYSPEEHLHASRVQNLRRRAGLAPDAGVLVSVRRQRRQQIGARQLCGPHHRKPTTSPLGIRDGLAPRIGGKLGEIGNSPVVKGLVKGLMAVWSPSGL